jgi:hypothetical protein
VKTSNDTNMTSLRNHHHNNIVSKDISADQNQQIFVMPTHHQQQQNNAKCNERQQRQMRMFKVILVLMCVFIMFRLPNWIFLLYKLNFPVEARIQWLINYSFSIVGIINSMVNPFLYTFLSHTIRFTSQIQSTCYKFCKLCRTKAPSTSQVANYANNATMFGKNDVLNKPNGEGEGGVYLGN